MKHKKVRITGSIKWFNLEKGYGILECNQTGGRFFAALSDFKQNSLTQLQLGLINKLIVQFYVDEETPVNEHNRAINIEIK